MTLESSVGRGVENGVYASYKRPSLKRRRIGFFIITVIGILGLLLSITPELIDFYRHR